MYRRTVLKSAVVYLLPISAVDRLYSIIVLYLLNLRLIRYIFSNHLKDISVKVECWINLKRKYSDVDDEKTPCIKKEQSTKLHKYDSIYLATGFTCNGSEEESKSQCVICFEVLSNEALKPSKLKIHFETKHKEHVTKSIEFF